MLPPMLHKGAGEIHERITVHKLLDKEVWECLPGRSEVECEGVAAFSPRGRFLAVGLADGRVGIWDFETMCHLVLTLGLPDQLQAKVDKAAQAEGSGDKTKKIEYEVAGLSWGACATRLLVALKEDDAAMFMCLWDIRTRELLRCTSTAATVGPPALLSVEEGRQECVLCTGVTEVAVLDLGSGQLISVELAGGEEDGLKKETIKAKQPGVCALQDAGRTVFCMLNRRVFRLEHEGQGRYREAQRSGDMVPGYANIDRLILSPDRRLLLACTSRGAYIFDSSSLASLQSLGGQSVQVDWAGWAFGFGDKIIGLPTPITYNSKQERVYVWTIVEGVAQGPDVKMVPQEGLSAVVSSPGRPMVVGISQSGALWMQRETFTSSFPGAMYPKGYVVLDNNVLYPEKEDELDKTVRRVRRGTEALKKEAEVMGPGGSEAAANGEAAPSSPESLEEADVDIMGDGYGVEEDGEWLAVRPAWGEEQHVTPCVEIRPLAEEAKEELEEEEELEATGGIPGLLPMPRVVGKGKDRMPVKSNIRTADTGRKVICSALERVVRKGPGPGVRVVDPLGGEQADKRQRTGQGPEGGYDMTAATSSSSLSLALGAVPFMPGLVAGPAGMAAQGGGLMVPPANRTASHASSSFMPTVGYGGLA